MTATPHKGPAHIGLHLAKTGGTTLLAHLQAHLGPENCRTYGPAAWVDRFFAPASQKGPNLTSFRLIAGHGVDHRLLALDWPKVPVLFCVLRDPFTHLVSEYKHHLRGLARTGRTVSLRDYFRTRRPDPLAQTLYRQFAPLAGDDAGYGIGAVETILRHFRYVMNTAKLDTHAGLLFGDLGVPLHAERRRVYEEAVDTSDLTPAEVEAANPLDARLARATLEQTVTVGAPLNPFGYDPDLLAASMQGLRENSDKSHSQAEAEDLLVDALVAMRQIRAAEMHAAATPGMSPRLASLITDAASQKMPDYAAATNRANAALYLLRKDDVPGARQEAEACLALVPKHADGLFILARIEERCGNGTVAAKLSARAAAINPFNWPAFKLTFDLNRKHLGDAAAAALLDNAPAQTRRHPKFNELASLLTDAGTPQR
ncbi:hypothetical protein [Gimibacter soli]|uniref:Sulfotransferase family protein n=1 Tax=Gimibacter soli TaxID=3024400 RepID=A0AAE9XUY3_9PROT|nr:hypothetical protein [Gimibacter soli]WCL55145.1 hypothetical protein PH603_05155 [Gimibacter soli]